MVNERLHAVQSWIGYLTLAIVLFSALMLGANRPFSWTFLSLFVFVVFAAQLIASLFTPTPAQADRALLPMILYLGVVCWVFAQIAPDLPVHLAHPVWTNALPGSGTISADPIMGRHGIMRLLTYAMVGWIIIRAASTSHAAWRMLQIIAVFSTALALYGFYALFTGNNPIMGDGVEAQAYAGTLKASFVNRNSYATFAAFGAFANIALYLNAMSDVRGGREGLWARLGNSLEEFFDGAWVFAFGAIVCVGAVTLTQSRAGGISALVGLFVLLQLSTGGKKSYRTVLFTAAAFICFFALTSATGLINRIVTTTDEDLRFVIYPAVLEGIFDRPLLGHGLGAFTDAFRPYLPAQAASGEWTMAHSSYLENIFELGIPAALILYLTLGLVTWRIWTGATKRRRNHLLPAFALSCIVTAAIHSILDFSLQMPASAALFAAILAIGFAQSFKDSEIKHKRRRSRPELKGYAKNAV